MCYTRLISIYLFPKINDILMTNDLKCMEWKTNTVNHNKKLKPKNRIWETQQLLVKLTQLQIINKIVCSVLLIL